MSQMRLMKTRLATRHCGTEDFWMALPRRLDMIRVIFVYVFNICGLQPFDKNYTFCCEYLKLLQCCMQQNCQFVLNSVTSWTEFKGGHRNVWELRVRCLGKPVDSWAVLLLNCGHMWNKIILKKFQQCFISHVTMSETEIKLFQPLKEFWNYFRIVSVTLNMLENIHELQ